MLPLLIFWLEEMNLLWFILLIAWSVNVYEGHVWPSSPPIFEKHNPSVSLPSTTKDGVMDVYKCDTFNLLLSDLLLSCDTDSWGHAERFRPLSSIKDGCYRTLLQLQIISAGLFQPRKLQVPRTDRKKENHFSLVQLWYKSAHSHSHPIRRPG